MKYVAAAMLLSLASDPVISYQKIKTILESVGIEPDENRLNHFVGQLANHDVNEVEYLRSC